MADGLRYDFDRREMLPFVPTSARRVLEIGCGSGAFGRLLRERGTVELWAVEPDPAAAASASLVFDRVLPGLYPEDAMALPSHYFDCIVMNDVLEHMLDPGPALEAAARHLSASGVIVASLPNVRHLSVVWPLVRSGRWTYTDAGILDRTHLRFYTLAEMIALFRAQHYDVVSSVGISLGPGRRYKAYAWALARRADEFFYPQFAIVARPRTQSLASPSAESGSV